MIVQCALLKCYTILGYSTETVLLIDQHHCSDEAKWRRGAQLTDKMDTNHITDWFTRGVWYHLFHVDVCLTSAANSYIINKDLSAWYHEPKLLLVSAQ